LLFYVIPSKVRRGGSFQLFSAMADFHWNDDFETFDKFIINGIYENKKSLTWEPGAKWGI
jgi:hypothetical protein